MQVKSIDHIHIYSSDPAASQAFWERHFGAARVFDGDTGYLLAVHTVPGARITDAAFSADASRLVTLCSDGMEREFDLTPERRSAEELRALISRRALLRFESDSSRAPVPNLWK